MQCTMGDFNTKKKIPPKIIKFIEIGPLKKSAYLMIFPQMWHLECEIMDFYCLIHKLMTLLMQKMHPRI